jgi:2'-5' RNA ligase
MVSTTGLAVVAIPSQDDYVWKISSEKVPHLTLLFLGDQKNANVGHMTDFLEHVVKSTMTRFELNVDRRGTLGDQDADVLFFTKNHYCMPMLRAARAFLLVDEHYAAAYHSVEQYPEWLPHLTLGYPKTPAKKDDREYAGSHWVSFDRVALWTGDYEGPEFILKDQYSPEFSMSDMAHYGIKGMKWGVHKKETRAVAGNIVQARKKLKKDPTKAHIQTKAKEVGGLHKISDKELQVMLNRMEMERKYKNFMAEESKRRAEGAKALGKVMLEVGKVAVPLLVGFAGAKAASNMNGSFRTNATVGRVIDGVSKTTDLVRR